MQRSTAILMMAALALVGACSTYSSEGDQCQTLADCNPGKECGKLTRCVDGKCDPANILDLPCETGCTSDADCPQESHCRITEDGQGVCVADGTCADVAECLGLPHEECLGAFACEGGLCVYTCLDLTSCATDGDCALADKDCCCGFGTDDYVAVRADKLDDWRGREECLEVPCLDEECMVPEGLRAICDAGQCATNSDQDDWYKCDQASDCVKVRADCCGCELGGGEHAINREFRDVYLQQLSEFCAVVDIDCPQHNACTDWPAQCHEGRCVTISEKCDCDDTWDPVCIHDAAVWNTLHSPCVAECLGHEWAYHGRCDCQVDCFVEDPVCAMNDVTYFCGEMELACNGQAFHYYGDCSEECDRCDLLGRPDIPVCSQDFRDYTDMCYAECHDVDWWHQGECLPGEGNSCNGHGIPPCPSDDLFCLIPPGCLECPGNCIQLGSCLEPAHCWGQPLPHDECEGHWECPDHSCTWECP